MAGINHAADSLAAKQRPEAFSIKQPLAHLVQPAVGKLTAIGAGNRYQHRCAGRSQRLGQDPSVLSAGDNENQISYPRGVIILPSLT